MWEIYPESSFFFFSFQVSEQKSGTAAAVALAYYLEENQRMHFSFLRCNINFPNNHVNIKEK